MSTQQHDQFYYNDIWFDLTASSGKLADIHALLGYRPARKTTACHRGYIAVYEILDNTVTLGYLETTNIIGYTKNETKIIIPGVINGVHPILEMDKIIKERTPNSPYRDVKYPDIAVKLPFAGALVIGDNLIRNNWGWFQNPWNYETVLEIQFEDGRFIQEVNLSKLAAYIRSYTGKDGDKQRIFEEEQNLTSSRYASMFVEYLDKYSRPWLNDMYD